MKNLLLILKLPDALLAFISGAFVSGAINIFTNSNGVDSAHIWTAVLMLITAIGVVCWMILVKPLEEEYKEHYKTGDIKKDVWGYVLSRKKNKIKRIVLSISSICALVTAVLSFLVIGICW